MIYPRSWNFLNTFISLISLGILSACSSLATVTDPGEPPSADYSHIREKSYQKALLTQFEWAVQYYESGDYQRAIQQLNKLEHLGSQLPNYQELFFYQGMTYYQLHNYSSAEAALLNYMKQVNDSGHAVEAKLTLLKIYETTKQWEKVLGQASELRKTQLYHDNKALLLLIWTRALIETGEVLGAQQLLEESEQILQQFPQKSNTTSALNKNQDLWGRLHYTKLRMSKNLCDQEAKQSNDKAKRWLLENWLEGESQCLKTGLASLEQVYEFDSQWLEESTETWNTSLERFFQKITEYRTKGKLGLAQKRKFIDAARRSLYILQSECEEISKTFEYQSINTNPLKRIQKRIEILLLSLSSPT